MHTPGQWSIESPCGHIRANVPDPHNGNLVNTHLFMQVTDNGTDYDERIANARLIASAPDLLTAAIEAMAVMDDIWDTKDADDEFIYDEMGSSLSAGYFSLRAAIAKATGANTP